MYSQNILGHQNDYFTFTAIAQNAIAFRSNTYETRALKSRQ